MSYAEAIPDCPQAHGDGDMVHLKGQIRTLVRMCGGIQCVADALNVSTGTVHNWQNGDDKRFPPMGVVLWLEKEAGQPLLSREMARLLEPRDTGQMDPQRMAIEFSAHSGRFSQTVLDAMADSKITRIELLGMSEAIKPAMATVCRINDEINAQLAARVVKTDAA